MEITVSTGAWSRLEGLFDEEELFGPMDLRSRAVRIFVRSMLLSASTLRLDVSSLLLLLDEDVDEFLESV